MQNEVARHLLETCKEVSFKFTLVAIYFIEKIGHSIVQVVF